MSNIKCVLFDCMETLIDIVEIPILRDYALWAYDGSGVEHYWRNFDEFFQNYICAKEIIDKRLPDNKEYDLIERFEQVACIKFKDDKEKITEISKKLLKNYWKTYTHKCYIKEEVVEVLSNLADKYQLGVVSNFKVKNGVEELLAKNGIIEYFNSITTSVNVGWRKPHPNIYDIAIDNLGIAPCEIVFVGDDYINDYVQPKKLGLNTIFLDRYNKFQDVQQKVPNFYELMNSLNRL
ncbi:HAD family hydrolase [Clostridium ganghwense]|uniref:HAD family hydrolase n=1 Tax=Clostridium ganghwense TaxID=312089 RepID=A0ABT4CQ20_9CLOT|nr:HAD family hydrolase [Clostridium ganghwense]MCY6371150.1 HAD family hydrolase [Clostridium ganghwense]